MENSRIEDVIVESLKEIAKYNNKEDAIKVTRVIIPYYREKKEVEEKILRHSEQELKQIFISLIENYKDYYYSVETPSKYIYSFSSENNPQIEKIKSEREHFESARFDVSLYKTTKTESLLSHVEFKHKNPGKVLEISKDLLKLTNENDMGMRNYFVHYIVRGDTWKSKTFPSVMEKYYDAIMIKGNNQAYLGHVIVFLMFYDARNGERTILRFDLKTFKEKYKNEINGKKFDEKEFNWMVVSE